MNQSAEHFRQAIRSAARILEARMIASGDTPLGPRVDDLARHLASQMEFSFYAMSAGTDPDVQCGCDRLASSVDPSDSRDASARLFAATMDLFGYAIRDDFAEFSASLARAVDGWPDAGAGPASPAMA